ncbi:MAG: hypothetical protein LBT66_06980 [Methanobrevibacter sp.]|jgi:hypothetical protein|nr:hypothetical protein [Candidatus Methanovirga meridionalis]
MLFGSFPNFDVKNLDLKNILLQSGYLTIKKKTINVAVKQIKENGCYKPYQNKKTIIFVGIAFKNKEVKYKILTYIYK